MANETGAEEMRSTFSRAWITVFGNALACALAATAAAGNLPSSGAPQGSLKGAGSGPSPSAQADAQLYDRCVSLAHSEPRAARSLADWWRHRGGAHPADHCAALALIGLGKYREGASQLEALAEAMSTAPAALHAEVFDQAGQAWLLAGDPRRAFTAERAAAALAPADLEILIDRAEAAAAAGYLDSAVADLDRVLKSDPNRVEALIYRASANRALGRLEAARADTDKALRLAPHSVAALLERGNIRWLEGDTDSARRDWAEIGRLKPGGPEDLAAQVNLERLAHPANAAPADVPASKTGP
jgi:tetratricopeptide (TPR) repeat protein